MTDQIKPDKSALEAAFAELKSAGGAGAIVRSCCKTCAMWELPDDVDKAETWAVFVDFDGTMNPAEFDHQGWLVDPFGVLCWGGNAQMIVDALRSQGFETHVPDDAKRTIGIRSLRASIPAAIS